MPFKYWINERIILPTSDIISGTSVSKYLNFLLKSQYWTREQLDNFQNERLKRLIYHAYTNVPYYHEKFRELNLNPDDIKTKNDLFKVPILTKAIIKKEGINSFIPSKGPLQKGIASGSSGSTGEPLFYQISKDAYSINIAASIRGWYWSGFRLGDRYIKLSQNPRKNLIKKVQDKMSNNLYLATNPLVEENFKNILCKIEQFKPKIIRCYPDPLLFLARYKKQHPEFKHIPLAIATTGNTLFSETRNEIEEVFSCKIFDAYSCEGNSTVFECPTHSSYHSAEEYGISEILDEYGNPLQKGIGRLISTDLWNFTHPFIRYDTQDLVEIDNEPCKCGRNLLKINRIIGRDNDVLTVESGRRFIVHNFTGFFQADIPELNKSIDQFQIIKKGDTVLFNLVVNQNYNKDVSDFIKLHWKREMESDIEINIVEKIPLTGSGKRKFILNS